MSSELPRLIVSLGSSLQEMREDARQRLVAAGDEAIPLLLAALDHAERDVRSGAALALAELRHEPAVERLATMAETDPDLGVRPLATRALSDMARPGASNRLKLALLQQLKAEDLFARALACRGLGRIGDAHCRRALLIAVRDPEEWVRQAAQQALAGGPSRAADSSQEQQPASLAPCSARAMITGNERLSALIRQLMSLDVEAQRQAQRALASHGEAAVSRIAPLLWDPMVTTRRATAETLAMIGGREAMGHLGALLTDDAPADLRAVILHAMARMLAQDPALRASLPGEAVSHHLGDGDPCVRAAALAVSIRSGGTARAKGLEAILDEQEPWVQHGVLQVLAETLDPTDRDLVPGLIDGLGYFAEPADQVLLLSALRRILAPGAGDDQAAEEPAVVGPASYFLRSDDARVRREALLLIAAISGPRLEPSVLMDVLALVGERDCAAAAAALAGRAAPSDSPSAVQALVPLLQDPDAKLACTAARALARIGGRTAIDALVTVANSRRGPVVATAAQALAAIDPEDEVVAVRRPDGRWERKLQLRCEDTGCRALLEWTSGPSRPESNGRAPRVLEELRCTGCMREYVIGPTGKRYDVRQTPLGVCRCCARRQLLIRDGGSDRLVCPGSGESHIRPFDHPAEVRLLRELPLGACGCCAEPQPLVRVDDRIVCYRTRMEHQPTERGFALAEQTAAVVDDVAAINQALLEGTLGIGRSGLPSIDGMTADPRDED